MRSSTETIQNCVVSMQDCFLWKHFSGLEQSLAPLLTALQEQLAPVQAKGSLHPEFDPIRHHTESEPVTRPHWRFAPQFAPQLRDTREQLFAAFQPIALVRDAARNPAVYRPRNPIRVRFIRSHKLDGTIDPDLASLPRPIKNHRGAGILRHLSALRTAYICIERKASLVRLLEQDVAHARHAVASASSQRHRLRKVGAGCHFLTEPSSKSRDRIICLHIPWRKHS